MNIMIAFNQGMVLQSCQKKIPYIFINNRISLLVWKDSLLKETITNFKTKISVPMLQKRIHDRADKQCFFYLYPALMANEQSGFFRLPHLLWHALTDRDWASTATYKYIKILSWFCFSRNTKEQPAGYRFWRRFSWNSVGNLDCLIVLFIRNRSPFHKKV